MPRMPERLTVAEHAPMLTSRALVQAYNSMKKMEHALKAVRYDGKTVSVVNPDVYSERFQHFMQQVFV